jgi:hypothetical protein
MPSKECAHCGKVLEGWQRKFCSTQCRKKWYYHRRLPNTVCEVCKKPFHNNWIKSQRLCSPQCLGTAHRVPLPTCELCGKTCKAHGRRFCSPNCKVEWYRGDNVYNYLEDGGKRFYASTFWERRAQEIRERDKVCQGCGFAPGPNDEALHVHHKIPRHVSNDHSDSNLIALCDSCHQKAHAGMPIRGKNRRRV